MRGAVVILILLSACSGKVEVASRPSIPARAEEITPPQPVPAPEPGMEPEAVADRVNTCKRLGLEPMALYWKSNGGIAEVQCIPKQECK